MGKRRTNAKNARREAIKKLDQQPSGIRKEGYRMHDLLSTDEEARYRWIHMVLDPWGPTGRIPLLLGNGIWDERLFRYRLECTMVADAASNAYCLVAQEDWHPGTGGDNYMGTATVGKPVWYTTAAYLGTASPAAGSSQTTAGQFGVELASDTNYGGAYPTSSTRLVQSAGAVRVRPISNSDTTGGQIMIVFSKDTSQYPLTNVTYEQVKAYPPDKVVYEERGLANWPVDKWFEMPALPLESVAFESHTPGATIATNVNTLGTSLGVFARGLSPGESIVAEAVMIYQIEASGSDEITESYNYGGKEKYDEIHNTGRGARAMMSRDVANAMITHSAPKTRPRMMGSNQVSPHPRNPRSQVAAEALVRTHPSMWQRIKALAGKGKDYLKDNWLSLLKGAATSIIPMLL